MIYSRSIVEKTDEISGIWASSSPNMVKKKKNSVIYLFKRNNRPTCVHEELKNHMSLHFPSPFCFDAASKRRESPEGKKYMA